MMTPIRALARSATLVAAVGMAAALLPGCSMLDSGTEDPWGPPVSCDAGCPEGWECLWEDCQWTEMLDAVNAARAQGADCGSKGRFAAAPPLRFAPPLTAAAQDHAWVMADSGCFSHDDRGPDPCSDATPCVRISQAGYQWSAVGENIALNNEGLAAAMEQWLDSDGHCANLLSRDFVHLGAGLAINERGQMNFVQTFGAPGSGNVSGCP